MILPKRNDPDLDDIPPDLRKQMQFVLVESIDEVLKEALAQARLEVVATDGEANGASSTADDPRVNLPEAVPAEASGRGRRARPSRPAAPAR